MPRTSSSMDSFMRSYFLNTARKAGIANLPIMIRPKAMTGTTITKVTARVAFILNAMNIAKASIRGALTAVLMTIMYEF